MDRPSQAGKGVAPVGSGDVAVAQVSRVITTGLASDALEIVGERLAVTTTVEVTYDQPDRVRRLTLKLLHNATNCVSRHLHIS